MTDRALGVGAVLAALLGVAFPVAAAPPNIVVVLCDDLGYGDVQCLNPERGKIPTPNVDSLAKQGMTFTDAHSGSSVCTPTRYGLLTGRYSWRSRLQAGVSSGYRPCLIAPDRPTVASFLKAQGYHTAIIGKWHLDFQYLDPASGKPVKRPKKGKVAPVGTKIPDGPTTRGFDTYHGFHHARDMKGVIENDTVVEHDEPINMLPRLAREAVQYIDARSGGPPGQPFFLYVPLSSPHTPIVPTKEWQGKSGINPYADFVMQTDAVFGDILAALDRNGFTDNTLVIFSSDNGCSKAAGFPALNRHGHHPSAHLRGSKADIWEGGHRIPFIVRWPDKVAAGSINDQLICLTDLFATTAALLGKPLPKGSAEDSVSFLPAFSGKPIASTRNGVIHHSISGHFAYRTGKWKLCLAKGSGGWTAPKEKSVPADAPEAQLYDLKEDPAEKTNLYALRPEVAAELLKQLESDVQRGRSTKGEPAQNDVTNVKLWKSRVEKRSRQVRKSRRAGVPQASSSQTPGIWAVDSQEDWESHRAAAENAEIKEGALYPTQRTATFQSTIKRYAAKRQAASLTVRQSDLWQNWNPCPNIGPTRLGDSPVLLSLGPQDYWIMGRCQVRPKKPEETVELPGYDAPLLRTAKPNEFIAPGGLEPHAGGYQAWHSRDMKNWVYYGSVTEKFSTWVTNAEYVDGKFYIYYDFPNDQDPHLYIDSDLTDGKPGKNMGLALADPSHGSDCTVIRDKGGSFHIVYEDWSPIFANRRSFDSPLAGHAVSPDGIKDFKILPPAVDERTTPTGVIKTYKHPHWVKEDPKRFTSDIGEYEVHTPEQYAYGDWAAICVGSQYYLFGDFDPPPGKHPKSKDGKGSRGSHMSVGWFTSESLDKQFRFCDKIGSGHPDPDICFAEDQFYLATQQRTDYTSPGPWVESVEVRVGVDTSNDGRIDRWTPWQEIKETYDYTPGFAKHVKRLPARLDLAALPPGYGFQFELKMTDTTENRSNPIVDHVSVTFE